jgi:hypothetical protein
MKKATMTVMTMLIAVSVDRRPSGVSINVLRETIAKA